MIMLGLATCVAVTFTALYLWSIFYI